MPATKSSKTPNIKPVLSSSRTDVSIRWSTDNIQRELKLIADEDRYRLAFFPQGLIKHKVCDVARELCIELMEDDPKYMEMLERRGQVVRKGRKWVPTTTWTSSYNNPVVTKYHEKRYTTATVGYTVRPEWSSFKDVPSSFRKEFQKSCPWYFMFKALDTGTQSPLPETAVSNLRPAARRESASSVPTSSTAPTAPIHAADPLSAPRIPSKKSNKATISALTPSYANQVGHSSQVPIEVGSDSDSSACVEITRPKSTKPKKSTKKPDSMEFRNVSEGDKVNLKRLRRQLRLATRAHLQNESKEHKIFDYVPTERQRYTEADSEGRAGILQRARMNLMLRVLRDLEGFNLPLCLTDCGLFIDPLLEKSGSARADQLRRIVKSTGGNIYDSKASLTADTERAVRIHLRDDGSENGAAPQIQDTQHDLGYRDYSILEFGRFLSRRIFRNNI